MVSSGKLKANVSGFVGQKEDLARLYRLFQRVPKGLDPVSETFKKHVEAEGMKLVKEATEAMEARKDKDAGAQTLSPSLSPTVDAPISSLDAVRCAACAWLAS